MKNLRLVGYILGVTLLVGSVAITSSAQTSNVKEVAVSATIAQQLSKDDEAVSVRFFHCETKDFIRYVAAQNILSDDELKTLESVEVQIKKLRAEKKQLFQESIKKDNEGASKDIIRAYDKKIDQLEDEIDRLYKSNKAIYKKVKAVISEDMVSVSKEGKALDWKGYLEQTQLFTKEEIRVMNEFNKMNEEIEDLLEASDGKMSADLLAKMAAIEEVEEKVEPLLEKLEAYEEEMEKAELQSWMK